MYQHTELLDGLVGRAPSWSLETASLDLQNDGLEMKNIWQCLVLSINMYICMYIDCVLIQVLAPLREDAAIEAIANTLQNAPNLVPGRSRDDVMRELGLSDQCAFVSSEKLAQIYKDR